MGGSGEGKKYNLTLAACDAATAWEESSDSRGNPQILAETGSGDRTCLNVFKAKCEVGATVHGGPCQADTSTFRKANHFHWDSNLGAIASDLCLDLCVDTASSQVVLAKCGDVQAWSRSSVTLV